MIYFRAPKLPGNQASEANIQHASKSSSNWHVNQDWWKQWKTTKDWNLGPKWPKTWASEAHILHTCKNTCKWAYEAILMRNQWKFFEKMTKDRNFEAPKLGPMSPIFYMPLRVVTMSMWNKSDVKPVETFEKMTGIWGPRLGLGGPYCKHLWK